MALYNWSMVYNQIFCFWCFISCSVSEVPCQSQAVVVQLRSGGSSDKVGIQNMDSDLHRRLERHFPDWEERMAYQEKQAEFYKSAMKKKEEIIKLRINYRYQTLVTQIYNLY